MLETLPLSSIHVPGGGVDWTVKLVITAAELSGQGVLALGAGVLLAGFEAGAVWAAADGSEFALVGVRGVIPCIAARI
eukprot:scaffold21158_cov71-Cyclotella_meneghiniana.AAC.6